MNNLFKFNSYSDKFVSSSNLGTVSSGSSTQASCVELSMTFMQLIPKHFEVPNLNSKKETDSYLIMFGLSFQFLEINESLELRKFRFSMMGGWF